jgi:hypothetical protein
MIMHTVAQTRAFVRAAADAGMTEDEIDSLVTYLSENPTAGEEMPGTGGCRKLRFAGRGKGKRGGYRSITFYTGKQMPVFLITVFAKGEKTDLSQLERNELRKLTKIIVSEYSAEVTPIARKGA